MTAYTFLYLFFTDRIKRFRAQRCNPCNRMQNYETVALSVGGGWRPSQGVMVY